MREQMSSTRTEISAILVFSKRWFEHSAALPTGCTVYSGVVNPWDAAGCLAWAADRVTLCLTTGRVPAPIVPPLVALYAGTSHAGTGQGELLRFQLQNPLDQRGALADIEAQPALAAKLLHLLASVP